MCLMHFLVTKHHLEVINVLSAEQARESTGKSSCLLRHRRVQIALVPVLDVSHRDHCDVFIEAYSCK